MPFIITCPTCRHQLTAHETQSGQVVACPTCRQAVSVPLMIVTAPPAVQAPPEDPFQLPTSEPGYRARYRGRSSIGVTLLVSGLGVWLISAGLLVAGYVGAMRAANNGDGNGVVAFVVPIYGGWCMGFVGGILVLAGLISLAVQAGVRDARD